MTAARSSHATHTHAQCPNPGHLATCGRWATQGRTITGDKVLEHPCRCLALSHLLSLAQKGWDFT